MVVMVAGTPPDPPIAPGFCFQRPRMSLSAVLTRPEKGTVAFAAAEVDVTVGEVGES